MHTPAHVPAGADTGAGRHITFQFLMELGTWEFRQFILVAAGAWVNLPQASTDALIHAMHAGTEYHDEEWRRLYAQIH